MCINLLPDTADSIILFTSKNLKNSDFILATSRTSTSATHTIDFKTLRRDLNFLYKTMSDKLLHEKI
jgi:hypothetical protein